MKLQAIRIPSLVAAITLFCASPAFADTLAGAMATAHRCPTETSWARNDGNDQWTAVCGTADGRALYSCWREPAAGTTRTYCGAEENHTCGMYAAWAFWACEHGYQVGSEPGASCLDVADEALEACGDWS